MPPFIVWLFLAAAVAFAVVHAIATSASLYWYYPWFDIVMHLWGGILISLGLAAIAKLRVISITPTTGLVTGTLLLCMISWEVFEFFIGHYDPNNYLPNLLKDLFFGTVGAIIGYYIFIKRKHT